MPRRKRTSGSFCLLICSPAQPEASPHPAERLATACVSQSRGARLAHAVVEAWVGASDAQEHRPAGDCRRDRSGRARPWNGMGHVRWQRVGRTRQARTRILLDGFEADYLQPESIPSAADGCWLPRTGRMFGAQRGHRRGNTNEAGAERLRFLGGRRRSALGPAKFGVSNLDLWSATKRPLAACRQTG